MIRICKFNLVDETSKSIIIQGVVLQSDTTPYFLSALHRLQPEAQIAHKSTKNNERFKYMIDTGLNVHLRPQKI